MNWSQWVVWLWAAATFLCIPVENNSTNAVRTYGPEDLLRLRDSVSQMFHHAYEGYLRHAYPYDELRPLSCDGVDTWGSYSLTLIDALDTLLIVGNHSEFRRVYHLIVNSRENFDADINVSVFETNIRILGGLLSGHLFAKRAGIEVEKGWPCEGPLLRLAEDLGKRLLPAFDTPTGMPYGTVNLRHGVPENETPVTCTAGVGTLAVEFGTLSRLTGDPIYEATAMVALDGLWRRRSTIGLVGNHIDVLTGKWTATDSGIGAGVDSYYEYLAKGSVLLGRPELLRQFRAGRAALRRHARRPDDWYFWVSMTAAVVSMPVFQSLEAFWPGVLALVDGADDADAGRAMHNHRKVLKQYGFLPEFFNVPRGTAAAGREGYPLRPEFIESAMYLYRATKDPWLLSMGEDILESLRHSAQTECGYATVKDVRDHTLEDRMESFFLAETTKYLYLLFDPDNFIHNSGSDGVVVSRPDGETCVLDAGGYIFNTEAHPVDPAALACCHSHTQLEVRRHLASNLLDILTDPAGTFKEFRGDLVPERLERLRVQREAEQEEKMRLEEEFQKRMERERNKEREAIKRKKELERKRKQMQESPELNVSKEIAKLEVPVETPDENDETVTMSNKEEESGQGVKVAGEESKKESDVVHHPDAEGGENIGIGSVEQIFPKKASAMSQPEQLSTEKKDLFLQSQDLADHGEDVQPEFSEATGPSEYDAKELDSSKLMIKSQSKDEAVEFVGSPAKTRTSSNVVEVLADMIKKMLPTQSRVFDPAAFRQQVLLSEDRRRMHYNNATSTWFNDHSVMACPARDFMNRFAIQGEFADIFST